MSWTTRNELKAQVQRLWDRGLLLAAFADGTDLFPRRLTLKKPKSEELSSRYAEVQNWIEQLSNGADCYRIEWRMVNHHIVGMNKIPAAIWVDSQDDVLRFLGKEQDASAFSALVAQTRVRQPLLIPWLAKRSLRALAWVDEWSHLLDVVEWLKDHPHPGIYPRQLALPGVHSKFIESHRGVLTELLDLVLPDEQVNREATGIARFCRRYGFREKPLRVRFRLLDSSIQLLGSEGEQDIMVTQDIFASLDLPITKIFITENEINFLSFPAYPNAMVLFGAGYGFEQLAVATWLGARTIYYWGDIDTHGFAILNQLRHTFPNVRSMLMDEKTLLAHRSLWGIELKPTIGRLDYLTQDESILYEKLCENNLEYHVRLEQEQIGYDFLLARLRGE